MKQQYLSLFVSLFFSLLIAGCATLKKEVLSKKNDTKNYTVQKDFYPEGMSRAEYYEQMAIAYSTEGQNEKAIEHFRLSQLHDAKRITPYLALSDEYRKLNKNHLALTELNQALKLEPKNADVLKKLGDLYMSTKLYPKARETYQRLLGLNKKHEEAQWALFYIFKLEKKYNDALSALAMMIPDDHNNYKIIYEKAIIYKLTKEHDLYNSLLAAAYEANPRERQILIEYVENAYTQKNFKNATSALMSYSDTHEFDMEISHKLSYSAVQSENYEIALREYDRQRPLTYDVATVDLKRAHVYYLLCNLEIAEKLYLSVLATQNNDEARFYLAQIYMTLNKTEDAAFILSRVPMASDYYGEARVRLALYNKSKGLLDDAMNTIHKALIERPDLLILYRSYAEFLIEAKRYVEGVALLEKGIKLFPKDEDLRVKMAYLHYCLHNQKSFKKEILAALQINPQSADVYAMLSELWYLKNKNTDELIYFVKKAMELKSTNINIKPLLSWGLLQQGNSTEAVAILEEFFEENPNESFFARSLAQVYGRMDLKQKAHQFAEIATVLESKENIKSSFLFKSQTPQVQIENYNQPPARLPASLEN